MEKILILGTGSSVKQLQQKLTPQSNVIVNILTGPDFTKKQTYLRALSGVNVIVSLLGPLDVDLDFEALFAAIRMVNPPVKQFVMLSTAGIDHEVVGQLKYPKVDNVKEYLNQQRYAAKVLDESELPYTILRPVNLVEYSNGKAFIIPEGKRVPAGNVSWTTLINITFQIVMNKKYIGESIGVIDS